MKLHPPLIRVVPLGGLGEIGMNCLALEDDRGILVVDCGSSFPSEDIGVDLFRPDFGWLLQRADRISGVVLTHGHEDHIGGLPYLLASVDVPVFGLRHTLGLVQKRLSEFDIEKEDVDLRQLELGKSISLGPFSVEPVAVSHSIIDACALFIETPNTSLFHTGDFNFEADPPISPASDQERMRAIGRSGVSLLLSDSTNVDNEVRQGSERAVGGALRGIIETAPQAVFVALFASNLHRLSMLGDIARSCSRKILLLGQSLRSQVELGRRHGVLDFSDDLLLAPEAIDQTPRDHILVLAGGSQAERNSALQRLAKEQHPLIKIQEGDTVVFSSRVIPGNERAVAQLMNDLVRLGVNLKTPSTDPQVHTSGHASRTEQRRMIELLEPRHFVPLHGTLRHMACHAELAREVGVSDVSVVENGTPVALTEGGLQKQAEVPHGKVAISYHGDVLEEDLLQARRGLGRAGVASVAVTLDRAGRMVAGPEVVSLGIPGLGLDHKTERAVAREIAQSIKRHRGAESELEEVIRRATRRAIGQTTGYRPEVLVHLLASRT